MVLIRSFQLTFEEISTEILNQLLSSHLLNEQEEELVSTNLNLRKFLETVPNLGGDPLVINEATTLFENLYDHHESISSAQYLQIVTTLEKVLTPIDNIIPLIVTLTILSTVFDLTDSSRVKNKILSIFRNELERDYCANYPLKSYLLVIKGLISLKTDPQTLTKETFNYLITNLLSIYSYNPKIPSKSIFFSLLRTAMILRSELLSNENLVTISLYINDFPELLDLLNFINDNISFFIICKNIISQYLKSDSLLLKSSIIKFFSRILNSQSHGRVINQMLMDFFIKLIQLRDKLVTPMFTVGEFANSIISFLQTLYLNSTSPLVRSTNLQIILEIIKHNNLFFFQTYIKKELEKPLLEMILTYKDAHYDIEKDPNSPLYQESLHEETAELSSNLISIIDHILVSRDRRFFERSLETLIDFVDINSFLILYANHFLTSRSPEEITILWEIILKELPKASEKKRKVLIDLLNHTFESSQEPSDQVLYARFYEVLAGLIIQGKFDLLQSFLHFPLPDNPSLVHELFEATLNVYINRRSIDKTQLFQALKVFAKYETSLSDTIIRSIKFTILEVWDTSLITDLETLALQLPSLLVENIFALLLSIYEETKKGSIKRTVAQSLQLIAQQQTMTPSTPLMTHLKSLTAVQKVVVRGKPQEIRDKEMVDLFFLLACKAKEEIIQLVIEAFFENLEYIGNTILIQFLKTILARVSFATSQVDLIKASLLTRKSSANAEVALELDSVLAMIS